MNQQLSLACFAFLAATSVSSMEAQNVVVPWSGFHAGGCRAAAADGLFLITSFGQPVVGRAAESNTVLEGGFLATRILLGPITGIPDQPSAVLPMEFSLSQNYPNPFNPSTTIRYQLPVQSHVSLKIYDVLGREVATLADELQGEGSRFVVLDADKLASGTYFYRLHAVPTDVGKTSGIVQTRKFLLMK